MHTIVQEFSKNHNKLNKKYPDFKAGDTVRVHLRIVEGKKERIQIFEGLVIKRKGKTPLTTSITVRKISNGVGVEKVFPLTSPSITEIDVVKRAKVRRAKLYFMRNLRGKKARLKETMTMDKTEFLEEDKTEAPADTTDTTETSEETTPEAPAEESNEENKNADKVEEELAEEKKEKTENKEIAEETKEKEDIDTKEEVAKESKEGEKKEE